MRTRLALILALVVASAAAQKPKTPPDLQGVWSNASIIPLERPKELVLVPE
jgi:hypothetical protein